MPPPPRFGEPHLIGCPHQAGGNDKEHGGHDGRVKSTAADPPPKDHPPAAAPANPWFAHGDWTGPDHRSHEVAVLQPSLPDLSRTALTLVSEAQAVETEALGGVVATAEFDDVGAEFAQATPLLSSLISREGVGDQGVAGGEPEGEEVGEGRASRRIGVRGWRKEDGGRAEWGVESGE